MVVQVTQSLILANRIVPIDLYNTGLQIYNIFCQSMNRRDIASPGFSVFIGRIKVIQTGQSYMNKLQAVASAGGG